ncbi:MAG: sigma-54 dependent transcriptional regulator [Candidatus Cloacimonetes bacterium]|nr:sigma-54 dependent transcriptional regulator [Candidatus Cloacimonadota bacterium]
MATILIIDDEKHMRLILSKILKDSGYKTIEAKDGKEALEQVQKIDPDLILLDYKLPDLNGVQILEKVKQINSNICVIMVTAYGDIKHAVAAMKLGAYDYLTKPFDNEEILLVIKKALENQELTQEVKYLRKKIQEDDSAKQIIGESEIIKKILKQIELVSKSDISVFLEGETGTGKDLMAKLIHDKSNREKKPFIAVDCGAIPETLFESEMFGFEKGAFTGALTARAGKFEQAHEGTIFLDEISNLPLSLQPKLLRVIQEKKVQRIGSNKQFKIDVRIIAASNQNIVDDVKSGKFRNDLFYRIHEFSIKLPTLKERIEDIPLIAKYFLNNEINKYEKKIKGFDSKAIKKLMNHCWPGNIRELRNVIRRAIILCENDFITADHLLFTNFEIDEAELLDQSDLTIESATKIAKTKVIKKAILEAKGNKTEAAKILGVSRRQLYWELDKLKID